MPGRISSVGKISGVGKGVAVAVDGNQTGVRVGVSVGGRGVSLGSTRGVGVANGRQPARASPMIIQANNEHKARDRWHLT